MPAHEFHYWDSTNPGSAFKAQKPLSERGWETGVATKSLYAGFPHFHFAAKPEAAARFVAYTYIYSAEKGETAHDTFRGLRRHHPRRPGGHGAGAGEVEPGGKAPGLVWDFWRTWWCAWPGSSARRTSPSPKRPWCPSAPTTGVVAEGVTQTGQEVTAAVAGNMARRASSVCRMAKVAGAEVYPVDIGMAYEVDHPGIAQKCIRGAARETL